MLDLAQASTIAKANLAKKTCTTVQHAAESQTVFREPSSGQR